MNHDVSLLPWAVQSPDLNPIEIFWLIIDRNGLQFAMEVLTLN